MQLVAKWSFSHLKKFLVPQEHILKYFIFKAIPEKRDFANGYLTLRCKAICARILGVRGQWLVVFHIRVRTSPEKNQRAMLSIVNGYREWINL